MSILTSVITSIIVVIGAYLLGSIPWGYVVGRIYGVDIRKYGSGKTGGTNLARLVGWPKTIPVAVLDPAKAVIAILVARYVTHSDWVEVGAALAAVAGHNWPVYLGFKGGRGVGPTVGSLFVFDPLVAIISGLSGIAVAVTSRFVSLGSICGAALAIGLSIVQIALGTETIQHFVFVALACGTIIAQHKDNIGRLLNGTERKLGERVQIPPAPRPPEEKQQP
jgi:acyl phosphate:glycerol-3-phosphate acyltransferase